MFPANKIHRHVAAEVPRPNVETPCTPYPINCCLGRIACVDGRATPADLTACVGG